MQSKFIDACKEARAAIAVPNVPLAAIRQGASQRSARPRHLRAIVVGASALALVAAVTATWQQTRVMIGGGQWKLTSQNIQTIARPSDKQLHDLIADADFPVTLPSDLPKGTVVSSVTKGGKSALLITYELPGSRAVRWAAVIVANPKSFGIKSGNSTIPPSLKDAKSVEIDRRSARIFYSGDEIVVIARGGLTLHEQHAVEKAMGIDDPHRRVMWGGMAVEYPTQRDITDVAESRLDDPSIPQVKQVAPPLAFTPVLPSGLPEGSVAVHVMRFKGYVSIQYSLPGAWRASDHLVSIVLADPKNEAAVMRDFLPTHPHAKIVARFPVGDELVLIPTSNLTAAEIANIRTAMQARVRSQR